MRVSTDFIDGVAIMFQQNTAPIKVLDERQRMYVHNKKYIGHFYNV